MIKHVEFLDKKIKKLLTNNSNMILTMPKVFEYYSAVKLTKRFDRQFYVYEDVFKYRKQNFNFPLKDHGIDVTDLSLNSIAQCKYYSSSSYITYGKLSTFLASEKLVGKKLDFFLLRTEHSKLDCLVKKMINRNDIIDIPINNNEFLEYINKICLPL